MAVAVSTKPWGQYQQSDYTDAQWERACILDRGAGNTAKERYALPVREPDGTLNRNGMAGAAAVLAGARGGVQASAEAKKRAANRLILLYGQIGVQAPPNLRSVAG